jgi:hypothetical protein
MEVASLRHFDSQEFLKVPILEYWSDGVLNKRLQTLAIAPILHYSNSPEII